MNESEAVPRFIQPSKNEAKWVCPYPQCLHTNDWMSEDVFLPGETVVCEKCNQDSIIDNIIFMLNTRPKPKKIG